ncbi:flagellar motor switch protein FliN [Planctomicrobium sp. SH668]|uniref:flagellar motor switch protein FliN n=1 Tax=Planctomicrobium sp. SH668 TaxID=3448126 RepID=UPI003F5BBE83
MVEWMSTGSVQRAGKYMDVEKSRSDGPTDVYPVEFPTSGGPQFTGTKLSLDRFYDVNMTISVELGRVTMPIGDLLQLAEGSVVQLERAVSQPVDIIAQGVRLARGEVVVVEDRYAVRITEIDSASHSQTGDSAQRILRK